MASRSAAGLRVSPLGYAIGAVLVLIGGVAAYLSTIGGMGGDDTGYVVFDLLDELCRKRFGASYRFLTNRCCDRSDPGLCQWL
jgi:hypothetical protein